VATAKFAGQDNANKKLRVPLQVKCAKKKHGGNGSKAKKTKKGRGR
jgi:hypothetical protein